MTARWLGGRVVATMAVVVAAAVGAGCGSDEGDELRGLQRLPVPDVSGFSLPEASGDGGDFVMVAGDGEVLVVYFGYTSCPDVCPTTMADTRVALEQLGDDAERVEVAMVTIDPARDTGERLTSYVQSFVPGAHALVTADDGVLRDVADAFGVSYEVIDDGEGEPEVSHTGFLYAVDDAGDLQVSWAFGTPADDIAHDLRLLLDA